MLAARDLVPHELRCAEVRDLGTEVFTVADEGVALLAAQVLADRHIFHLGCDDAATRVLELGDVGTRPGAVDPAGRIELRCQVRAPGEAVVLGLHLAGIGHELHVPARNHPGFAGLLQALLDIDAGGRVGVGAGRIVQRQRWLIGTGVDGHHAERHADVGPEHAGLVDLFRPRTFARGNAAGLQFADQLVHARASSKDGRTTGGGSGTRSTLPFAGMTRIRFDGSWAHPPLSRLSAAPRGELQGIPLDASSPVSKWKTKRPGARIIGMRVYLENDL